LVATLQLCAWLFFSPSAWRNHIARIAPVLQPDFSVAKLTAADLRNPPLRRVLLLGYLLAPTLMGVLLTIELIALRVPLHFIVVRVSACVIMAVAGGLTMGAGSFAAVGIAAGVLGVLAGGIAFAIGAFATGQVVFSVDATVSAAMSDFVAGGAAGRMMLAVAMGVACGGLFVWTGSVASGVSLRKGRSSLRPRLGGLLIGLVCGAFFFVAAVGGAMFLPFDIAVSMGGVLAGFISAGWMTRSWRRSLIFGILCGVDNHILVNIVAPLSGDVVIVGIILGIVLGAWFALPFVLAEEIAGVWAGAAAGLLGFSGGWLLALSAASREAMSLGRHTLPGLISLEAAVLIGLTERLWRPLLLFPVEEAWAVFLHRWDVARAPSERPSWLRLHPAFWDEYQTWPLHGLDKHLVLIAERDPQEGRLAIERVAAGRQRWAALAAHVELDARRLERCQTIDAVAGAHRALAAGGLEGPGSTILRRLSAISQDVEVALEQGSSHNQRLGLGAVQQRLDGLIGEFDRSSDRFAVRCRPLAVHWRQLIGRHAEQLAEAVERRQEIDNPYVIGVPLSLKQEIFVGRTDISGRIEQLLLDRRRPPLLLHGQRRMGKTSLLNNLGRLLPTTIVPLFVDLQGPASSASDHAGLLYNLSRGMVESARRQRGFALPPLARDSLTADPFTRFDEWLDEVEASLGTSTALLALDEFEALVRALELRRFDEDAVLGMLRHMVQHRQRIKTLLASSHTLDELSRCATYLINVQVVQVGYLKPDEALRLVEHPTDQMALRYEPDASQRVLALTRGHPFLVQLLCAEIVTLKNEQDPLTRRLATVADVMQAVPAALSHGSFFFADIERNQMDPPAKALLKCIAKQGEGVGASRDALAAAVDGDVETLLSQLMRRELIEPCEQGHRFQVELIRRWFAQIAA
jgi:hypothetical protein